MTFEEWFIKQVGVAPVPGSFVEMAWNAAIDATIAELQTKGWKKATGEHFLRPLKTPLNTPTSPEQGQAKGVGASRF